MPRSGVVANLHLFVASVIYFYHQPSFIKQEKASLQASIGLLRKELAELRQAHALATQQKDELEKKLVAVTAYAFVFIYMLCGRRSENSLDAV